MITKVSITIPSLQNDGAMIPEDVRGMALLAVQNNFTDLFGGCTTVQGFGIWKDGLEDIRENVTIISSFIDHEIYTHQLGFIRARVEFLKTQLSQDCMLVTVEVSEQGNMYLW